MNKIAVASFGCLMMALLFVSCRAPGVGDQAYKKEIEEWRQKRFTRLSSDQGWLTLCGFFWLNEGENKMGSDSTNLIIFPPSTSPAFAGSLFLDRGSIRMEASKQSEFLLNDSVVTAMVIQHDNDGNANPTILNLRALTIQVIKRGTQFAVRVKNRKNPPLLKFKGMEYFEINPEWRIEARFEPYVPAKIIPIATVINTVENDSCPGAIIFEKDGKEYRLDAVIERGSEQQLFIMFSDETAGKETYGLGRQVYTDLPHDNRLIIDFNKAYNWPCVFTPFATCPIPPRQNRLALRIDAGEKMYAEH